MTGYQKKKTKEKLHNTQMKVHTYTNTQTQVVQRDLDKQQKK